MNAAMSKTLFRVVQVTDMSQHVILDMLSQRCWLVYIKLSYHLIQTSNVHLQSVFNGSAASYDTILAHLMSIPVPNTCFYLTELFRSGAAWVRSIDINQSSHFPNPDPPTRFRNVHHTRFGTPSLEMFPA